LKEGRNEGIDRGRKKGYRRKDTEGRNNIEGRKEGQREAG
jgi:hypothetical protein